MRKRANGEGTIYSTIQRNKRKDFLKKVCNTCATCKNKCNREQFERCNKCINCEDCLSYCDRYYCYKVTKAQLSIKQQRKAAGTGKNANEVKEKKDKKQKQLNIQALMKNGNLTLEETMKQNEENKLKFGLITENSYNRNINTINLIKKYPISFKVMYELTEEDLKELFSTLVKVNTSQSNLDKVFDEIHQACIECKRLDLFDSIKRNTFVSKLDKKKVIAFTIEEEKQLLQYIDEHADSLVKYGSKIDSKTVKNLIKFAFATSMRIGEICSLDKNNDIDLENKRVIVRHTVTRNINHEKIIGSGTKTSRKKKRKGENDIRYVPFDVLFDSEDVEKIIDEQKENSTGDLLFCTVDGKIIEHSSINAIFKRLCKEAGIKLELTTGCHIHMTKHTGVTRMKENGMDIYAISKIVGTTVEILTKTYTHIFDDFIYKEIEKSKKVRAEANLKLSNNDSQKGKIIQFSKYAIK